MPVVQSEKKHHEMTIGERITLLAKQKADTINAFAVSVLEYKSNSTLTGAIKNNNPTYETLWRIISKTGVSVLWLMKGEGEMYATHLSEAPQQDDCVSTREAIEMIDTTVKRITDSHNAALALIDRMIGTHESVMRNQKLIT